MKTFLSIFLITVFFFSLNSVPNHIQSNHHIDKPILNSNHRSFGTNNGGTPSLSFGRLPLHFIHNNGQVNKEVLFYAKTSTYTIWVTKTGLVFDRKHTDRKRSVSEFCFLNADKNPKVIPVQETQHKVNYFIGKDKSKWHRDIPTSQAVLYESLYQDIDLKVYGIEKQIEYDWIVHPGANPENIRFQYKHVKKTTIDKEGNLLVVSELGKLMHKKPFSYQEQEDGTKQPVQVKYKKITTDTYGFDVASYDRTRPLIIDPVVLTYSTYLGGSVDEEGFSIVADTNGFVYLSGPTDSDDFPTLNQYQDESDIGDSLADVFITKIDTNASGAGSLIYSTYLGGNDADVGYGIAVDGSGNAYVTGDTYSTDFPTLNQYQDYSDINDADVNVFVTKLSSAGNSLLFSTYLGGNSEDSCNGIVLDNNNFAYIVGFTGSTDYPTLNQYQDDSDINDALLDVFLTKLDTTQSGANSLLFSTYLGGDDNDEGNGIAVNNSGVAYITGFTESTDFPTLNQYQDDGDINDFMGDGFVASLDTTQTGVNTLVYSTYLGGSDEEGCYAITLDGSGNAYVVGDTFSHDFPLVNPLQSSLAGVTDAFVAILSSTGSNLIYSTYLGGSTGGEFPYFAIEWGNSIALDNNGYIYVSGATNSTDFPLTDPVQSSYNGGMLDVFVTKLTPSGDAMVYSTYLGGTDEESADNIALDNNGSVYLTGYTYSADFPVQNAYTSTLQGSSDVFVAKLGEAPTVTTETVSNITLNSATCGGNVTVSGVTPVTARGVCWSTSPEPTLSDDFTDNGSGTGSFVSSITGLSSATTYYVRAYATNSCGTSYGDQETFHTDVTLSGTVTDGTNPLQGATITFSHDNHQETTDVNGDYSYVVPYGTTTTIIPTHAAVTTWTPTWIHLDSVSSDMSNQDFQATIVNALTISGTVNYGGSGLGNVTLTGLPGNPTTDASGNYTGTVYFGWSGTVTPTLDGYLFTPEDITYSNVIANQTNQNYTALSTGNPVISGTVTTENGNPLSGVTLALSHSNRTAVTNSNGNYSLTVASGWSGTVTPSKEGYEFIPPNRAYTGVTEHQTNDDFVAKVSTSQTPEILVNRKELNFGASLSGSTTGPQTILIENGGDGTLNWTIASDQSWLNVSPGSGTNTELVSVSVTTTNLSAGSYTGTLTVSAANAGNSPQTVTVNLDVSASTKAPFGVFSTPLDSSTVRSSIAVTGWVLDDVGVESVKIYRELGKDLVYIGDAVFVEGARPDVELSYYNYPLNYRAGWGYMLLTNFLPNSQNGTVTLHAVATDSEGNTATLGTKTITLDNAHAVKPFGALDTPQQGGTASGSDCINWGWVLTPMPNKISVDGSTIAVYIDGVNVGNPEYNLYRIDIATLFPDYANSNGAVGNFHLDTTQYTNGVHTIQWRAVDNAGNKDGIGSRYFTIQNVGADRRLSSTHSQWLGRKLQELSTLPVDSETPASAISKSSVSSTKGAAHIDAKELELMEVNIGESSDCVSGFMIHGKTLGALPVGSTLKKGVFYWSPGPGFYGQYRFLFVIEKKNGAITRKELTVNIKPLFPGK